MIKNLNKFVKEIVLCVGLDSAGIMPAYHSIYYTPKEKNKVNFKSNSYYKKSKKFRDNKSIHSQKLNRRKVI